MNGTEMGMSKMGDVVFARYISAILCSAYEKCDAAEKRIVKLQLKISRLKHTIAKLRWRLQKRHEQQKLEQEQRERLSREKAYEKAYSALITLLMWANDSAYKSD